MELPWQQLTADLTGAALGSAISNGNKSMMFLMQLAWFARICNQTTSRLWQWLSFLYSLILSHGFLRATWRGTIKSWRSTTTRLLCIQNVVFFSRFSWYFVLLTDNVSGKSAHLQGMLSWNGWFLFRIPRQVRAVKVPQFQMCLRKNANRFLGLPTGTT